MQLAPILARDPALGEFVRKAAAIASMIAVSIYILAIAMVAWSFFAKGTRAKKIIAVISSTIMIPSCLIFSILAINAALNYTLLCDFSAFGALAFFGIPALLSLIALRQVSGAQSVNTARAEGNQRELCNNALGVRLRAAVTYLVVGLSAIIAACSVAYALVSLSACITR